MIEALRTDFSVRQICEILGFNRSNLYYRPKQAPCEATSSLSVCLYRCHLSVAIVKPVFSKTRASLLSGGADTALADAQRHRLCPIDGNPPTSQFLLDAAYLSNSCQLRCGECVPGTIAT